MYKIFLIIILFLNVSLVNAEELDSWGKLVLKGTTYFKKSNNKPFTGILKNFHSSKSISLISNFKEGKQHGEFKTFHLNGELSIKGQFVNGKKMVSGLSFTMMVPCIGN